MADSEDDEAAQAADRLTDELIDRDPDAPCYIVEITYDRGLGTWHFHVHEPRILGGGQPTIVGCAQVAAMAIKAAVREAWAQRVSDLS